MEQKRRIRKGKKGYIRTLEAFIAFFITFLFVVFVVLKGVPEKSERPELKILQTLEQQKGFRECVYADNATCVELIVDGFIPKAYEYQVSINKAEPPQTEKNIFTETLFVTPNRTNDYKTVYLFYYVVG